MGGDGGGGGGGEGGIFLMEIYVLKMFRILFVEGRVRLKFFWYTRIPHGKDLKQ